MIIVFRCVSTCVHMFPCLYAFVCVCVRIHTYVCTCVWIHIYIRTYVCMYVCMYVRVRVCVLFVEYARVCMRIACINAYTLAVRCTLTVVDTWLTLRSEMKSNYQEQYAGKSVSDAPAAGKRISQRKCTCSGLNARKKTLHRPRHTSTHTVSLLI